MWTRPSHAATVCALVAIAALQWGAPSGADADPKFFPKNSKLESKDELKFGDLLFKDMKLDNFRDVEVKRDKEGSFDKKYKTDFKGVKKVKGVEPLPFRLTGAIKKSFKPTKEPAKWDTEIVSLNLKGQSKLGTVELKKNKAGLGSLRSAILIGNDQDLMMVDSFFDVFFEVSVDGATPVPASSSARFALTQTPEPASLALVAIGLAGLTAYRIQRRKRGPG